MSDQPNNHLDISIQQAYTPDHEQRFMGCRFKIVLYSGLTVVSPAYSTIGRAERFAIHYAKKFFPKHKIPRSIRIRTVSNSEIIV